MQSGPARHVSRVYDAAMGFPTHPTGEVVQRPAGFKRLERSFRRLRLDFSSCIYEVTGPRYALLCFVTHVEAMSAPTDKSDHCRRNKFHRQ